MRHNKQQLVFFFVLATGTIADRPPPTQGRTVPPSHTSVVNVSHTVLDYGDLLNYMFERCVRGPVRAFRFQLEERFQDDNGEDHDIVHHEMQAALTEERNDFVQVMEDNFFDPDRLDEFDQYVAKFNWWDSFRGYTIMNEQTVKDYVDSDPHMTDGSASILHMKNARYLNPLMTDDHGSTPQPVGDIDSSPLMADDGLSSPTAIRNMRVQSREKLAKGFLADLFMSLETRLATDFAPHAGVHEKEPEEEGMKTLFPLFECFPYLADTRPFVSRGVALAMVLRIREKVRSPVLLRRTLPFFRELLERLTALENGLRNKEWLFPMRLSSDVFSF